jgi:hypothetical protein
MPEKKSALAERAKELEEAVTRLFRGQGPAPKAQPRKGRTLKKATSRATAKIETAANRVKETAKTSTKRTARKAKKARR